MPRDALLSKKRLFCFLFQGSAFAVIFLKAFLPWCWCWWLLFWYQLKFHTHRYTLTLSEVGLFLVILCYNILLYPLSSYYWTSKNLCLYICTYFLIYVNVYCLFPPDHLICLLRNLYSGQEATVRTGHGTMNWFKIGKGVQQGCILSPCLFNLHAEYITWNARLNEAQAGIKIAGRNIDNLRYADDTTLMAEN